MNKGGHDAGKDTSNKRNRSRIPVKRLTGHTHTHTTGEQTTHTNTERTTAQRHLIVEVVVPGRPVNARRWPGVNRERGWGGGTMQGRMPVNTTAMQMLPLLAATSVAHRGP